MTNLRPKSPPLSLMEPGSARYTGLDITYPTPHSSLAVSLAPYPISPPLTNLFSHSFPSPSSMDLRSIPISWNCQSMERQSTSSKHEKDVGDLPRCPARYLRTGRVWNNCRRRYIFSFCLFLMFSPRFNACALSGVATSRLWTTWLNAASLEFGGRLVEPQPFKYVVHQI